jgi:hypothetical protein
LKPKNRSEFIKQPACGENVAHSTPCRLVVAAKPATHGAVSGFAGHAVSVPG